MSNTQTQDIDTAAAAPLPPLKDLPALFEAVAEAARTQLVINAAEAHMQAEVEAAKIGFEKATAPHSARIQSLFAQIEQYCEAHKDTLFPVKGGKRKKTFTVLQHALQYRSSTTVEVPKRIVEQLLTVIESMDKEIATARSKGDPAELEHASDMFACMTALEGLIRHPAPEFNKDAAKAITNKRAQEILKSLCLKVGISETFKLAFNFSPEQPAA